MSLRFSPPIGASEPAPALPAVFADPYLELVRLLTEAAQLEHTLLLADLRCLFSIKARYVGVRGELSELDYLERSPSAPAGAGALEGPYSMLDVAIEEMQHLDLVNAFLCALQASPCLVPHPFPDVAGVYPFPIPALGLDRYAAAVFMWVEAAACTLSLSPGCAGLCDPDRDLIAEVRRTLADHAGRSPGPGDGRESHVGSIYHRVLELTSQVAADPPAHLAGEILWDKHVQQMRWVAEEGEVGHYRFFRDVFTGAAFGAGPEIWEEANPDYPSLKLAGGTAYPGHADTIADETTRRLAWFADLHYWVVLALLDARYRAGQAALSYHAIDVMTLGLFSLGTAIAERGHVVPFDTLGPSAPGGRGFPSVRLYLQHLVAETQKQAAGLQRDGLLPPGYDMGMLATVATALDHRGTVTDSS